MSAARAGERAVGWDADSAIAWQRFPRLDGPAVADACVVGLGGSGLAAVGELLGRGLSVIGIDAGRVAGRAAGRNGGFLLAGHAIPVHEAAQLCGAEAAVDFYRQTLAEIAHLQTLLGGEVIRQVGSLRIAGLPGSGPADDRIDKAAERADCDAQYDFMKTHGLPVQRYQGPLGAGLYFPGDAAMNPVRRGMGLAALYGGRAQLFERSPAVTIEPGCVITPFGEITAETIVVAVDGRLETVLPQLAGKVRTARLQMSCTAPTPAGTLSCPVYANFGYDYLQQDDCGRIFAGGGRDQFAEDEWTEDSEPTDQVQDWIAELIRRVTGDPEPRITHRWAASVGYTPDSLPLVTQVADGLVACGGYCGTGNLVGPIAARAAVALALDGTAPDVHFSS